MIVHFRRAFSQTLHLAPTGILRPQRAVSEEALHDTVSQHNGAIYVAGSEGQDFALKYTFWLTEAFKRSSGSR